MATPEALAQTEESAESEFALPAAVGRWSFRNDPIQTSGLGLGRLSKWRMAQTLQLSTIRSLRSLSGGTVNIMEGSWRVLDFLEDPNSTKRTNPHMAKPKGCSEDCTCTALSARGSGYLQLKGLDVPSSETQTNNNCR